MLRDSIRQPSTRNLNLRGLPSLGAQCYTVAHCRTPFNTCIITSNVKICSTQAQVTSFLPSGYLQQTGRVTQVIVRTRHAQKRSKTSVRLAVGHAQKCQFGWRQPRKPRQERTLCGAVSVRHIRQCKALRRRLW